MGYQSRTTSISQFIRKEKRKLFNPVLIAATNGLMINMIIPINNIPATG